MVEEEIICSPRDDESLIYDIYDATYDTGLFWHLKYRHWMESWVKPRDELRSIDQQLPTATIFQELEPQAEMRERIDDLESRKKVICSVCGDTFSSLLDFERHVVSIGTPDGEHIKWLEDLLGKTFAEFGWKSEKEITIALTNYWWKYQKWPEASSRPTRLKF